MSDSTGSISVSRHFRESAERVFDAWLDPAIAKRFLFATATGEMVRAETEPRVGGKFVFTDRRDGNDVEHTGIYLDLTRPSRIVFDFAVPKFSSEMMRVTVEIRPDGAGSEVIATQDGVRPGWEEKTKHGWSTILNGLASAVK